MCPKGIQLVEGHVIALLKKGGKKGAEFCTATVPILYTQKSLIFHKSL
jgi:hypothetical protein